ncbi:MAG: hypothetical protein FD175_392 [Beijerinckiaceae bacterium]|nr:MAG: hypothetical protein FD175_392 [Beijerinckiaceae bacterium]
MYKTPQPPLALDLGEICRHLDSLTEQVIEQGESNEAMWRAIKALRILVGREKPSTFSLPHSESLHHFIEDEFEPSALQAPPTRRGRMPPRRS